MGVNSKQFLRWAVPAAAVAIVAGAALTPRAMAEPTLPPKTAEQLLVDLKTQEVNDLTGTVEIRADLGIPALPGGSDSGFGGLVAGTHTLRVWQSGDDKSRVSLVDPGAETSLIRNGQDVWTWSSEQRKATHTTVPADRGPSATPTPPKTPQQTAQEFLAHIEPTTEVTVSTTATVAGRSAYELVLKPKSDVTLVDKMSIAVDAENSAPLRVEVWPRGAARPAMSVGFTQVDFTAPDDSVFQFTPPAGVTVEEVAPKTGDHATPDGKRPEQAEPTRVGEGWETVMVTKMPEMPANTDPQTPPPGHSGGPADWQQYRDSLPDVQGPWGSGKVLTSSLFTVVMTDDGRVAAGLVPTERVVAAIPQ